MDNNSHYDLVIIGAGPAGLTAAIYGARAGLTVALLERGMAGGMAATTDLIENYPGFPAGVKGPELGDLMARQAERFGVRAMRAQARGVKRERGIISVTTDGGDHRCSALIVATGTYPKALNVPGEMEFRGKGVTYCATCDGPLFKGADVAVVGCGNSGLQEGRFLLNFVNSAAFIETLPHMTADKVLQDELKCHAKARFMLNHRIIAIKGTEYVESITVKSNDRGEEKNIKVKGVFIYVGLVANSGFLKGTVDLDEHGFIVTADGYKTSMEGVYAAGDIRAKDLRQIVTACADGAGAAMQAYHYVRKEGTAVS